MKRAHICLVAIVALHIVYPALWAARFWLYPLGEVLDGGEAPVADVPVGIRLIDIRSYWLALLVLLFLWCRADATDRRIQIPSAVSVLVSLLFPIGVPYYFFRTYPLNRALVHIGWAVAFVVICIGTTLLLGMPALRYFETVATHR
jgi:hypothetical protein